MKNYKLNGEEYAELLTILQDYMEACHDGKIKIPNMEERIKTAKRLEVKLVWLKKA